MAIEVLDAQLDRCDAARFVREMGPKMALPEMAVVRMDQPAE